jgi:uncharacterized protein YeaO (DUF488 family)
MPVKHAIWTVDSSPQLLGVTRMPNEALLEEMIVKRPDILSGEWMLIGRQEKTDAEGRIDLLAIAPDASLVLIELKRGRTPREVVAQALDYAAWVEQLTPDRIAQIYQRFSKGGDLAKAFKERFGEELDEDSLNQSHQIILVAAELDGASERIIKYLNGRDIPINVIFFQVFESGAQQLLSRAWLIDPGETQANASSGTSRSGEREPWNGEYYVSFGGKSRSWEEASKFGFISGGGGSWYSQTLKLLKPGDRIWVKIPKTGFVGVGRVTESMRPVDEFLVKTPEGEKSLLELSRHAAMYEQRKDDPDKAEYFVGVEWLDTVPEQKAFNEIGLFGNQNTVCQPRTPKWRHTIDRLKKVFRDWNAG